jgi:hypothetical protein
MNDIACDIAMGGVVTEEWAINRAQYLDLIYSQMDTLYDLLPDAPHPSTTATSTTPASSHAADGVVITEISSAHGDKNSTSSNINEVIHGPGLILQHSKMVKNYTK